MAYVTPKSDTVSNSTPYASPLLNVGAEASRRLLRTMAIFQIFLSIISIAMWCVFSGTLSLIAGCIAYSIASKRLPDFLLSLRQWYAAATAALGAPCLPQQHYGSQPASSLWSKPASSSTSALHSSGVSCYLLQLLPGHRRLATSALILIR